MLWFPLCWGTAVAGIELVFNLMSQNVNPSFPQSLWPAPLVLQTQSPSLWMHVRGCKLPRGKSGFRLGSLEENLSPGKSKLDEICPSFFFFPHSQHLKKVQPHDAKLGREMLNKIPNQQNKNFQRNENHIPWSAAPTLLLGLCFWNWN